MEWASLLSPAILPSTIAATLMAALAAWLLYLNAGSPMNRGFGALLFLRATAMWALNLTVSSSDFTEAILWWRMWPYASLAVLPALVYFVSVYPRRRGWIGTTRWGAVTLIGVTVAVELAYFFNHGLVSTIVAPGAAESCLYDVPTVCVSAVGPLYPLHNAFRLVLGLGACVFAWDYLRAAASPRRSSLLFVCTGFTLGAAFLVTFDVLRWDLQLNVDRGIWDTVDSVVSRIGGLLFAAAGVLLIRSATKETDPGTRRTLLRLLFVLPLPVLSAILLRFQNPSNYTLTALDVAVRGLWFCAMPLLATYALIRHRLFDLDIKIKWTISRGSVAFVILGAFFVVSQIAQNFLSQSLGLFVGGAVAGLLLFAIAPLQRAAEHIANAAMPGVKPVASMSIDERANLYRDMARAAWSDGRLDRTEQNMLRELRQRLGLTHEQAERLEADASG